MMNAPVIFVPPPPKFFEPSSRPKFLQSSSYGSRKQVPRPVVAAAVAALTTPRAGVAVQEEALAPSSILRRPDDAYLASWPHNMVTKTGSRKLDLLERANEELSLVPEVVQEKRSSMGGQCQDALFFGDVLRLLVGGERPSALSVAPRGCAPDAEERIAAELRGSGRVARGFSTITAVPLPPSDEQADEDGGSEHGAIRSHAGAVLRRTAWEIHRADPLDGFPLDDSTVHYGQCVRFGQRPSLSGSDEVLLACEPPQRDGGAGAPYIVLGRSATFGHPDPRAERRKSFDTCFRLLPAPGTSMREGAPVNLRKPVLLQPVSPFAYLHGARTLRICPSSGIPDRGDFASGRNVLCGDRRELLLEAAPPWIRLPPGSMDAGRGSAHHRRLEQKEVTMPWIIQRLVLPVEDVEACNRRRLDAHTGLPRALLGRVLEPQPLCVRSAASTSLAGQDTRYFRWVHLRTSLLVRLRARGPLGLAKFRKAFAANRPIGMIDQPMSKLAKIPAADEVQDERILLAMDTVVSVLLLSYGLQVCDEDLALLASVFGAQMPPEPAGEDKDDDASLGNGYSEKCIDADLFADALRGETSPGRHSLIARLYAELQREAGIDANMSLVCGWVEARLWRAVPADQPGAQNSQPELMPEEVMGAMPLVRNHSHISREEFVRWVADLTFHIPSHAAFLAHMQHMWGGCFALTSVQEEWHWGFQMRPQSPPPPHGPPYIGTGVQRLSARSTCFKK